MAVPIKSFFLLCVSAVFAIDDGAFYPNLLPGYVPPKGEEDNIGKLVLLKDAAEKYGAVCIDGTPSAFYFAAGQGSGVSKWYIHQQGGGWCESVASCWSRSKTRLGSSKTYKPTINMGSGYFSNNPDVNPQMYNWNKVYIQYCDGGSFSGNNESHFVYSGEKLYFRGYRNLQAAREKLIEMSLDKATDVVISGCSAGGLATYLHSNWWQQNLPKNIRMAALPDSGWFVDYESVGKHYHSSMQWVFHAMNSTSGVNQECIEHYKTTGDTWRCIFAQYTAPFIKMPVFPLQSRFDSWQTAEDLDSTNVALINEYGKNMTVEILEQLLQDPKNGIYLDSCHHHCGLWGAITISGLDQARAFQQFFEQKTPNYRRIFFQDQNYECKECCKGHW